MTVQLRSRWTTALAVAALLAPAAATAQDTTATAPTAAPRAGRTHTVRAGDTLWDLARVYLNDPFLWPEIYRLNTEVVEDPHWIYPGEVLRLPDGSAAAPVEGAAVVAAADEAPSSAGSTVFAGGGMRARGSGYAGRREFLRQKPPLIRAGDFYAAPVVGPERGMPGAGRVGNRVEVSGIAQISASDRLQHHDVVAISLPQGRVALQGERYLTYRIDEQLGERGAVLVPTGVLQVERIRTGGETLARIVDVYDQVRVGQHVVPLDSFAETPRRAPAPVADGVRARVLWINGDPVLPSLNRYLVLSATERDGIALGDQFTLYGRAEQDAPTQALAIVQVVKVSAGGVTGMIIDQSAPGIAVDTPARLTAKMP